MDNYDFYQLLDDYSWLFVVLILSSGLIHYLVFRKFISTLFDPYLLSVVASAFSAADVALLYISNNISVYIFSSFLLTQISFWFGIYSIKTNKQYTNLLSHSTKLHNEKNNSIRKELSFYFFSIVFIISQTTIYAVKGIPLFMASRLDTFAEGTGEGVLGRLTDVTSIFILYYFLDTINIRSPRIKDLPKWLIIAFLFLSFLLSGSKSSFLITFSVFWSYMIYSNINGVDYSHFLNIFKKYYRIIIITSLILVSGIIIGQNSKEGEINSTINPLISLGMRFIHSGDVYWYAYPNNIYMKIDGAPSFKALFLDALGLLRIYAYEDLPQAIGITLKDIHHPSDTVSGPNARHNVFGLIYFGFFGSIIFSYGLGLIISFIRNSLPKLLTYSTLSGFIFTYLVIKLSLLDTDPMLGFTYVNNILIIFPVLYIINIFITDTLIAISSKEIMKESKTVKL